MVNDRRIKRMVREIKAEPASDLAERLLNKIAEPSVQPPDEDAGRLDDQPVRQGA